MRAPETQTRARLTRAACTALIHYTRSIGARVRHAASTRGAGPALPLSSSRIRSAAVATMAAAGVLALAPAPASAQDLQARIVEWDCPLNGQQAPPSNPDPNPGALIADGNLIWFVTRDMPRLVRFTPGSSLETVNATCNWWDLDPASVTTGGLRFKPYSTYAFVRGITDVQRVSTAANQRTRWVDGLISLSDVAVKVNGSTASIYTTGSTSTTPSCVLDPLTCLTITNEGPFVVQRFNVSNGSGSASITRWEVGGGAGSVQYSGIDVSPCTGKVYYSEPLSNSIGELNTANGVIRRWDLTSAGVTRPRQLNVDNAGMVWVVAGDSDSNAALVRLNPASNSSNILVAPIPLSFATTPIALDANGRIGFTSGNGAEQVGMLDPEDQVLLTVPPVTSPAVSAITSNLSATPVAVTQLTGPAKPVVKIGFAAESPSTNGTYVTADVAVPGVPSTLGLPGVEDFVGDCMQVPDPNYPDDPCAPSTGPQGIAADPMGGIGTYYAAIGNSFLRIAHVALPVAAVGAVTANGRVALTDPITGLPTGDTALFTLSATRKTALSPVKGQLTYTSAGGAVTSLQITDLTFAGNSATITGLCKTGTSCTTFKLTVVDGGWQPAQDQFTVIRNPILGLGVEEGGALAAGSVKVYHQ